ncbi:MAG: hypothetical protein ABL964_07505 [Steroidobacteraceae bacterium]
MTETASLPAPRHTRLSPLIIGVSGHRDLHPDCIERVRAEVTAFVDRLTAFLPNSQIRVMVGMAQGADLLVAQAALDRHLPVDAVLPMPLEQYADDFGAEPLLQLREMLKHPDVRCIELEGNHAAQGESALSTQQQRDLLYVNLTDSLIRKSNLLIALWDGENSHLPGGTADTVLKYLDASPSKGSSAELGFVDDSNDATWGHHFVYWVPAPRRATTGEMPSTRPCYLSSIGESLLRRHSDMPVGLRHQLEELDNYNREFAALTARGSLGATDSLLRALPPDMAIADSSLLEEIDMEYGKADALAVYYQSYSDRLFKWFSLMASAMGLMFLIYAKLLDSKVFLVGYLLVLLLGLGVFYTVREKHWFSKHLVYRALAETMRTKFFLRLASADRHLKAQDLITLTGIDQFEGFSWITNVLKNVEPFVERNAPEGAEARRKIDSVHRAWIEDQEAYFRRKVRHLEHVSHRLEKTKGFLFFLLVLMTLIIVFFSVRLKATELFGKTSLKDGVMFLMGLLPVWLGIWEIYQNKMATRELLWQYRNQLRHFSRARLQLARDGAWQRHATILAELGRESLMESYLWTIHRYHREHEPPASG